MSITVSIIIPSAGLRPELLQRAINSSLIDDGYIKTQIIVVLNGRHGMDFDLGSSLQHSLVYYYKIEQGNVCKARNYGLSVAQGELIRFLDDDDFLISDVAYQQYIELYDSDAELSTYSGAIEDHQKRYQVIEPININDYYSAVMSANCPALTFATVYKKNFLGTSKWNEESHIAEDEEWMRTLSYLGELKWIHSTQCTGVWFQHGNSRLSFNLGHPLYYRNRAESIIKLLAYLDSKNNLTLLRRRYAAQGLWSSIHGGFHFAPIYWTKVALHVRKFSPKSRPENLFFDKLMFMNPILLEWLLIPIRWCSRYYRKLKSYFSHTSYVRKL